MSLTNKALFVIERNLDRDLSLAEIAQACGVSRFHLAHAFGEATGRPVMDYVRGRRLTLAAEQLTDGARSILDVALSAGYGSHEAFTRAFRAQFGLTPEEARRRGAVGGLVPPLPPVQSGTVALEPPRFVEAGPMTFVGLAQPCSYDAASHIPAQWQRFMRDYYEQVENKAPTPPVGVSSSGESEGEMLYVAAAEVTRAGRVPAGLSAVAAAPARYAVFHHREHVTLLPRSYAAIWDGWFPDSGFVPARAPGLERHEPGFNPRTGHGGVMLWVPLA